MTDAKSRTATDAGVAPRGDLPNAGATLAGRYRLDRELGRGGMGQVFAAHDQKLGRDVAVKLLLGGVPDEQRRRRFEQEARAAGGINHPNIVTVYDVATSDGGPCIVSELLEGETLRDLLARGPLPAVRAADLARQIAEGLVAAHDKGVVHRDLKPANLFITREGRLKILDFGIAKLIEPGGDAPQTQSGAVLGTVGHMSPEQIRGEPADARSDVFAAGVILHQMLSGAPPFDAPSRHGVEDRILHAEPDQLPADVPAALERIARRCLEKEPSRRFQSARDLSEHLSAYQSGAPAGVSLLDDLKRRRVFRSLLAYGVVTFAVLQIIEPVMHGLRWPDAVLSYVVVGLAVGFPLAAILAWAFDVKAFRIVRAPPAAGLRRIRLTALLLGIGALAAAPGLVWYLVVRGSSSPAAASVAPSIAVLPFADLSPRHDQDHFSDGVAAEIISSLAQIEGLRVVGRTSSFSFRKNEDLREIGQKLRVGHVLEGSVQWEGSSVRVSATLVGVADGYQIWSKTFTRELKSILALQDDIAREVATALRVKLLPGKGPGAQERRSIDPEAYNLYLLANRFQNTFKLEDVQRSVPLYEKALALDPGLAPAWAMLAISYWWLGGPASSALAAAEKAVALDPGSGAAYAARGVVRRWARWDISGATADDERSLALSPNDPWVLGLHCHHELTMGRYASTVAACRQASDLDPLSPAYWNYVTFAHLGAGEVASAKAANARALVLSPESYTAKYQQCQIAFFAGDLSGALDLCGRLPDEVDRLAFTALARFQLGDAAGGARALQALIAKAGETHPGMVARVYAERGETDRAFEWLERAYALESTHTVPLVPYHDLRAIKLEPLYRKLRGDPRYAALVKKLNLPMD